MLLFCLPGLKKEKSFLTSSFQESLCVRQKIGWFDVRHSICESMVFFFFQFWYMEPTPGTWMIKTKIETWNIYSMREK